MKSSSDRAVIGVALGLGVLCLVLPPSVWLEVGTRLSPDGDVGDASVAHLVGQTGRIAATALWLFAAGWWRRTRVRDAVRWIATCPTRTWLAYLAIAVVLPRVVWMLLTHTIPHVDLAWYDIHAKDLLAGHGYVENGWPSAFWPIGYPAFLAALYRVFGMSLLAVKVAQVLLSYVTAALLWRVGRRVLPESGARLAALAFALCPSAILFTELLSTETLFATLLVAVWALVLNRDLDPWRRRVFLGLLVGLGVLVKPVLLPWPFIALLLAGDRTRPGRILLDLAVTYAVALCVIAPWTYRNYRAFDRFALVSTNAGFNLYVGNGPGATGAVRTIPESEFGSYRAMENEAERDAALRAAAVAAIRADPGRFGRLVPAKLAALLRDDSAALRWAASGPNVTDWSAARALVTRLALDGYYYGCGLLVVVWALRRGWRESPGGWAMLGSWAAYILLVHAVYYGDPRYHQVLWPLLALAAAGGAGALLRPGGLHT